MNARSWIEALLAFVYPNLCQCCRSRRATAREGFVCSECARTVEPLRAPFCQKCGLPFEGEILASFQCSNCRDEEFDFDTARAAVAAKGLVRNLIHRYKYQGALWFEPFLADLLIREAGPALAGRKDLCLVPIPLHPLKEREREFNQADRLATRLGSAIGVPIERNLLRRRRATETQTHLSRAERARNVARAFVIDQAADLSARRCVLIDDVLTTGATTNACAKLLKKMGAAEVTVWTVARGI